MNGNIYITEDGRINSLKDISEESAFMKACRTYIMENTRIPIVNNYLTTSEWVIPGLFLYTLVSKDMFAHKYGTYYTQKYLDLLIKYPCMEYIDGLEMIDVRYERIYIKKSFIVTSFVMDCCIPYSVINGSRKRTLANMLDALKVCSIDILYDIILIYMDDFMDIWGERKRGNGCLLVKKPSQYEHLYAGVFHLMAMAYADIVNIDEELLYLGNRYEEIEKRKQSIIKKYKSKEYDYDSKSNPECIYNRPDEYFEGYLI